MEVKLRAKHRQGFSGSYKGGHNNNNAKRAKAALLKGEREAAQAATVAHQRVMVLLPSGHRRFMTAAEWEQMSRERNR
jgi:hypothetical protein